MDIVSEIGRIPLLDTTELNIYTFLNLLTYNKFKTDKINKEYKKNGL